MGGLRDGRGFEGWRGGAGAQLWELVRMFAPDGKQSFRPLAPLVLS